MKSLTLNCRDGRTLPLTAFKCIHGLFDLSYGDTVLIKDLTASSFKYFKRTFGVFANGTQNVISFYYFIEYNNIQIIFDSKEELVRCTRIS